MKRVALLITVGLLVYLLGLVFTLPARDALGLASQQLQARGITLAAGAVDGSAWSGRAAPLMVNRIMLDAARWDLRVWPLLAGRVAAELDLRQGDAFARGDAAVSRGGAIWLDGVDARLPASRIAEFIPPGLPVALEGAFSSRIASLEFDGRRFSDVAGRVVWSGAAITAPMALTLGDLVAELGTDETGEWVVADVRDAGGPLALSGEIAVNAVGAYRVELRMGARESAPDQLKQTLGLLGQPDREGRYTLRLNGRL